MSFLLTLLIVFGATGVCQAAPDPEFDRVEGATVYFKSAETFKPIKTDLFELKYLATLKNTEDKLPPYFFFSGKPCATCSQPVAIYAFKAGSAKPLSNFVYPGKILDPKTRALLFESRAFLGRCLYREKSDIYLSFQKDRVDRRRGMQQSVLVVEPGATHLDEKLLERGFPRLADTLKLVKSKQCKEIEGKSRLMLTKPLDLNPHRQKDDEDDDDDEEDDSEKSDTTTPTETPATPETH